MKRKDWKINKLKKNFYDNIFNFFYKSRRIFFLRRLYIRKNNVLLRKNIIPNYIFFKKILDNYKLKKNSYILKYFCKNLKNHYYFFPNFFITKKLFNYDNSFKVFLKNNNLNYIFLKKYFTKDLDQIQGLNIIVFNNSLKKLDFNELNKENFTKELNDKEKNDFLLKYNQKIMDSYSLNFFFNYNLYLLNSIEIYKIIILLYILKNN